MYGFSTRVVPPFEEAVARVTDAHDDPTLLIDADF